ncbi:hypothetical protein LSCM1_08240 [Leishmania martiniquensis]|uniref:Phosphoglycan beta 1,3 galactosyltransferase n=1 Tax=Leishmania martiniquensis TaxID=1580590 RepID=A0A836KYS9_9TRYP|nr:hypothetical protein LSCM1_08240 [Leishmania martiniquensis]
MEEEVPTGVVKRRSCAGAGHTLLTSTTPHDRSTLLLRHDVCAEERVKMHQQLPNAANEYTTGTSSTSPLFSSGHAWASTSLQQRTHASAHPEMPSLWSKSPDFNGGAAGTRRRLPLSRMWKRRPARNSIAMVIATGVVFLVVVLLPYGIVGHESRQRRVVDMTALQPIEELKDCSRGTSVLVQHDGLAERLLGRAPSQECTGSNTSAEACAAPRLSLDMLPAWTLRLVDKSCRECIDTHTYWAAVEGVPLHKRHGVFATSSAPLGRVGPMLLAMASVTDDVNVRAELRRWEWLRRVYGKGFPIVSLCDETAAPPRTPYLAVMGIPSTDQPARAALREAQRKTWLGYQEVARTENHFTGALLALYVLAAVEPSKVGLEGAMTTDVTGQRASEARKDGGGSAEASDASATYLDAGLPPSLAAGAMCLNTSSLLPTVEEYKRASDILRAAAQGQDSGANAPYMQRRVVLRDRWRLTHPQTSPCARIEEVMVGGVAEARTSVFLARALSLPVTPAFVAAATHICCASSALWQEALAHRNVLWIDMMTDRRPTTKKRLGEEGNWGLPVEVGMSQKLILWLEYAYHAFPTVPFIIKGDDDTYVKVPQFLSDVRYVRNGVKRGRLPPPPSRYSATSRTGGASATKAAPSGKRALTYEPRSVHKTKCFYWGSGRRMLGVRFKAGMLFMMHRRLAQIILEPPQNKSDVDLGLLAAQDFSADWKRLYREIGFQHEDVLIGMTLRKRYKRAEDLCDDGTIWYVKEGHERFHDLHRGKLSAVSWSTVVAHRCQPADAFFLHYYFQNEHTASTVAVARGDEREELAIESAAEWVQERRSALSNSVLGWDNLPLVMWTHNVSAGPEYVVADGDSVAVYNYSYMYWKDNATLVLNGYKAKL